MDRINQVAADPKRSFCGAAANKPVELLGGAFKFLTSPLHNSTIGIALFDRNLQCRSSNGVLRRMMRLSPKKQVGKQLRQLFPTGLPKLELAFRRVWTSGNSLSNLELTAQLPAGSEPRRWLVNFYPVSDKSRRVRLVATTFSEITKGRSAELVLSRLRDKFRADALQQPHLIEGEFSALTVRTFEIVNRSVALLRNSLSLRIYMSEVQLEAALVRHALFMKASRPQGTVFSLPGELVPEEAATPASESPDESALSCGGPSPREREILHHLADGKSNKEIGAVLDISTRTVECYRARIMLKLDLHSTAALVRYAVRNKIVDA